MWRAARGSAAVPWAAAAGRRAAQGAGTRAGDPAPRKALQAPLQAPLQARFLVRLPSRWCHAASSRGPEVQRAARQRAHHAARLVAGRQLAPAQPAAAPATAPAPARSGPALHAATATTCPGVSVRRPRESRATPRVGRSAAAAALAAASRHTGPPPPSRPPVGHASRARHRRPSPAWPRRLAAWLWHVASSTRERGSRVRMVAAKRGAAASRPWQARCARPRCRRRCLCHLSSRACLGSGWASAEAASCSAAAAVPGAATLPRVAPLRFHVRGVRGRRWQQLTSERRARRARRAAPRVRRRGSRR